MKTVLLCEDDAEMVTLIRAVVERAGYGLITASDGRLALQLGLSQDPDLILMDLLMPNADGIAATKMLRIKGYKKPIVILTASERKEDRVSALKAGATAFIVKTLAMSDVEEALSRLLGGGDAPAMKH